MDESNCRTSWLDSAIIVDAAHKRRSSLSNSKRTSLEPSVYDPNFIEESDLSDMEIISEHSFCDNVESVSSSSHKILIVGPYSKPGSATISQSGSHRPSESISGSIPNHDFMLKRTPSKQMQAVELGKPCCCVLF